MLNLRFDPRAIVLVASLVLLSAAGSAYVGFRMAGAGMASTARKSEPPLEQLRPTSLGPTLQIGQFTVNLASASPVSARFLRATVWVEMDSGKLERELKERDPQIRDRIITIIRTKPPEALSGEAGLHQFRQEILEAINALLSTGKVLSVFFTDFVIQ